MKALVYVATLSSLFISPAFAEPELRGTASELANYLPGLPRTVNVIGEGEIKAQADRAVITLRVTTDNKSLAEALRENEEVRAKLAAYLKDNSIGSERIQASRFSSTQKSGVFSDKVKSHRVDNLIKVTAHDEKEFQKVAGAPDKFPELSYGGAEFEHSEKEVLRAKAVAAACDNANKRKAVFEERLGLKLTPRRFNEERVPSEFERRFGAQGGTAPSFAGVEVGSRIVHGVEMQPPLSPFGELVFKVFVTVEYSVETK